MLHAAAPRWRLPVAACWPRAHPRRGGTPQPRRAAVAAAAGLLLLCALDSLATGLLLPRHGFYPIRGKWLRWPTQAEWAAAERAKRDMPRAAPPPSLPVWVLSLATSADRRAAMERAWAGANFTYVDALTRETVPPEILETYISRHRRRAAAGDAYQAAKNAIDASHLRLAHRLASEAARAVVVLEDDVEPAEGRDGAATVAAVRAALAQLPADWDIFYLTGASCAVGGFVGPSARIVTRGCTGTYAFAATPRFAMKVLSEAAAAPGTLIDLLFASLVKSGAAAAYAADPPLARHAGWNSTYADDGIRAAVARLPFWEAWRLEGRRRRRRRRRR
ncbi:hypothetical protein Rsub_07164 [Raphidocelis subcapitata]|uniref:Glycosyl transferase family 25 domain-containing protein n=1 Tax=Raphidocelis subcapitata TaxID=307507 RepID=A0A2V0PAI2_9CHLO|nr:hypothetical protein Rsub_07164 [Raphidocelis subcapitata]|eukprot:GBF94177.1 hypothetical protein Rsub_07164 [Raphidocelis subcapitata]